MKNKYEKPVLEMTEFVGESIMTLSSTATVEYFDKTFLLGEGTNSQSF